MAVDPSPLLLPNTSGRLAVLGMLHIMYVGLDMVIKFALLHT